MWKTIEGFENYCVDESGNVKVIATGKLLYFHFHNGYHWYSLYNKTNRKQFSKHRLVAIHFIPKVEDKTYVNHKDGNKLNSHYSNLEWCTMKENTRHAIRTGLNSPGKYRARKICQFSLSGEFIQEFESTKEAERKTKVFSTNIINASKNKYFQANGFRWSYKEKLLPAIIPITQPLFQLG